MTDRAKLFLTVMVAVVVGHWMDAILTDCLYRLRGKLAADDFWKTPLNVFVTERDVEAYRPKGSP